MLEERLQRFPDDQRAAVEQAARGGTRGGGWLSGAGAASRLRVLILTLGGLVMVAAGVAEASPVIYTYSEEEQASVHHGRVVTAIGTVPLLAAAGLLVLRGRPRPGAAARRRATACLAVTLASAPTGAAWPWLAFLLLAPVALGAALPTRR